MYVCVYLALTWLQPTTCAEVQEQQAWAQLTAQLHSTDRSTGVPQFTTTVPSDADKHFQSFVPF